MAAASWRHAHRTAAIVPGPLILYVPGLKPKPEAIVHRDALLRCLLAGLEKVDKEVARQVRSGDATFDIVSWTYDFYGEHRDIAIDQQNIEALLQKVAADADDRREARSWSRRTQRWLYQIGDRVPFLIPRLANENVALQLRDMRRYVSNDKDAADKVRRQLKILLQAAAAGQRPVLLLAHSMGSVIAWDTLWQLSEDPEDSLEVDVLMTLGSPLGQRYVQRRLLGHFEPGARRYPANIGRWINVAAVGELTALDRKLQRDFGAMVELGLLSSIEDYEIYNWYREQGVLNVHAEYGYLANRDAALHIADWWRTHRR